MRVSSVRAVTVALLTSAAGVWVACSLPEEGILDNVDGAGGDVIQLPPGCTTLDAACLGTLPAGWQPVSVTDAGACQSGFDAATLLVNPTVGDGGCACGACQAAGSFTCTGLVAISGGNQCGDPTLVNAAVGSCTQGHAQHIEAHQVQANGAVGCFAANDAGAGAAADTLTVCVPGCDVDFCGSSSRCILAEGDVQCPSGFSFFAKAGTGADPGCKPCPCEAGAPGPCGGRVTAFESSSCTDSGLVQAYDLGTCNVFDNNTAYNSVLVTLTPPDASCFAVPPSGLDLGDASLTGVKTICCQ